MTKTCSRCGIEKGFEEFNKNQSAKSGLGSQCKECKAESGRKLYNSHRNQQALCKACNKNFFYNVNKTQGIFCSRQCTGRAKYAKVKLQCSGCNEDFLKSPCQVKKSQNFCSNQCRRVPKVKKLCKNCKKYFVRPEYYFRYNQNTGSFCSKECSRVGKYKYKPSQDGWKFCTSCGIEKSFNEFSKNITTYDKLQNNCKSCSRLDHYQSRYGLNSKQVEQLSKTCAICGSVKNLCIDHSHTTNKIRGILCASCNTGLGSFYDSIEKLQKAQQYLQINLQ